MFHKEDDKRIIEFLDKVVWLKYPETYKKIHVITEHSEDFRIIPKYSWYKESGKQEDYADSVKEVFDIIRENPNYKLHWFTGPCEYVRDIKVLWTLQEALGLPFIKKGGDLVAMNWDTKEKLIYKGLDEKQKEEYHYANIILGFEEPDEEFKSRHTFDETDTYLDWIQTSRKIAQRRQKKVDIDFRDLI